MNKKIVAAGLCAVLAGVIVPFAAAQAQTSTVDISSLEQQVAELKARINEVIKLLQTKNQNRPGNSGMDDKKNEDALKSVSGTIESVDTGNKSFKLKSGDSSTLVKVVYTTGTKISIDGMAGDEGDLVTGLKVVVRGAKDSSGVIVATAVKIAAVANSHDDGGEDATDEDKEDVEDTEDTEDGEDADNGNGNGNNNRGDKKQKKNFGYMNFGLEKLTNEFNKEVKATESFDEPYILQLVGLTGEAAPVNSDTIKVDVDGDEYTVKAAGARIIGDDDRTASVSKIANGDIVTVVGTLDDDTITATVIHIITVAE